MSGFLRKLGDTRNTLRYYLAATVILVVLVFALVGLYSSYHSELAHLKLEFANSKKSIVEIKKREIEQFFKAIYESIRTMSLLPGVRDIDRSGSHFDANAKQTIQQIYNNLFLNSEISEFYLLPANFDPEKRDPFTGKPQTPILTFDNFVTDQNRALIEKEESANKQTRLNLVLKEEEIHEYREMKKQIEFFAQKYPTNEHFGDLRIPAMISHEVITCDNTNFSIADFQQHNDKARLGFVYTVPKYNHHGLLSGAVATVFRTQVIENLLASPNLALVNRSKKINLVSEPGPALLETAEKYFQKGEPQNPNLIYSNIVDIALPDDSKWELWVAYDDSEFFSNSNLNRLKVTYAIVTSLVFIFAIIGWVFIYKSYSYLRDLNGIVEDRTRDLRNTVHRLEESQAQLIHSSKMSSLGEMATGMAHEINNPLAIIMAKSSQLQRLIHAKSQDYSKMEEHLIKIENTTERIAKIIKGLRAFARNDENDEPIPNSVGQIIEDTLELCYEKVKLLNIHLKVSARVNTMIECRSAQISQVIMNLVGNAIDAVEHLPEKWITIESENIEFGVRISVTDAGHGIPPEVVQRLMEPFFTTKETGKGTGLGLSISKGIIESHHGRFFYDKTSPHTRFVIELPLKQDAQKVA